MVEIWKDIKGYEGKYQVSSLGNIKSLHYHRGKTEVVLKCGKNKLGYLQVHLRDNGKTKSYLVHRIVAETFIENPSRHKEINHKDENKANNRIDNLEWCGHSYNCNYGARNGKIGGKKTSVLQYDRQGNLVKRWCSISEASRGLGKLPSPICNCLKGRKPSAYGFVWKYAEVG